MIQCTDSASGQDGTYKGTKDDFKEAWSVISAAVKDNKLVKMFVSSADAHLVAEADEGSSRPMSPMRKSMTSFTRTTSRVSTFSGQSTFTLVSMV